MSTHQSQDTPAPLTAAAAPVAAATQSDGRSIVERMEAAAQLLHERRVSFTEDQERRFLEKFAELVELYEATYPGERPPLCRYDANLYLVIQWPEGWSKKRLAEIKRRKALEQVGPL